MLTKKKKLLIADRQCFTNSFVSDNAMRARTVNVGDFNSITLYIHTKISFYLFIRFRHYG